MFDRSKWNSTSSINNTTPCQVKPTAITTSGYKDNHSGTGCNVLLVVSLIKLCFGWCLGLFQMARNYFVLCYNLRAVSFDILSICYTWAWLIWAQNNGSYKNDQTLVLLCLHRVIPWRALSLLNIKGFCKQGRFDSLPKVCKLSVPLTKQGLVEVSCTTSYKVPRLVSYLVNNSVTAQTNILSRVIISNKRLKEGDRRLTDSHTLLEKLNVLFFSGLWRMSCLCWFVLSSSCCNW